MAAAVMEELVHPGIEEEVDWENDEEEICFVTYVERQVFWFRIRTGRCGRRATVTVLVKCPSCGTFRVPCCTKHHKMLKRFLGVRNETDCKQCGKRNVPVETIS